MCGFGDVFPRLLSSHWYHRYRWLANGDQKNRKEEGKEGEKSGNKSGNEVSGNEVSGGVVNEGENEIQKHKTEIEEIQQQKTEQDQNKKRTEGQKEKETETEQSVHLFVDNAIWTVDEVGMWVEGFGMVGCVKVLTAHSFVYERWVFMLDEPSGRVCVWDGREVVREAEMVWG